MQKQVRLFFLLIKKNKKKKISKVQREVRTKWNDGEKKDDPEEKSRIVRDRLKRQQRNYRREDRLKWTKRDYERPGEAARGTYLDVWCHSWVWASLSSLKWEETMDSSPAATGHHRHHRPHLIVHFGHEPQKLPTDNRLQPGSDKNVSNNWIKK